MSDRNRPANGLQGHIGVQIAVPRGSTSWTMTESVAAVHIDGKGGVEPDPQSLISMIDGMFDILRDNNSGHRQ